MITPQPGASLYEQIAAGLRADIVTGRLRPGQQLPSELRLQQENGVSRETARRAIAVLRNEGLAVVQRGHGVVVREQPEREDLVPPAGATVTIRMPTAEERALHDIPDGVPIFWVIAADGTATVYPGDRWQIRLTP
ncbi:winged helix-turn-helix domain-containing protein [Actinoplanes sp. NPDC023936]|uniref:winged helix-turn-helix domain-containing protein n=1 Tax=Actinoplanes sp. NPDC023936 TaxID=3154910 RepID=UPI0033C41A21